MTTLPLRVDRQISGDPVSRLTKRPSLKLLQRQLMLVAGLKMMASRQPHHPHQARLYFLHLPAVDLLPPQRLRLAAPRLGAV